LTIPNELFRRRSYLHTFSSRYDHHHNNLLQPLQLEDGGLGSRPHAPVVGGCLILHDNKLADVAVEADVAALLDDHPVPLEFAVQAILFHCVEAKLARPTATSLPLEAASHTKFS
jgi:hypothetical protein